MDDALPPLGLGEEGALNCMGMTSAQLEAIHARGNTIVVAGAGTGKTSTLVERCIELLDQGCSIDRILMVTFTEAAAAEMKHRLHDRLAEMAIKLEVISKRAQWWQEQLALLDTARICTMHSFCLQLVRENFHLLGIDPAVKVLDEQQTRPLISAALEACLEPHFAGTDQRSENVRELIRRYGQGDVERIFSLILRVYDYAQTLDAPERWFDVQLAAFEEAEPTAWRASVEVEAVEWAKSWWSEIEASASAAENLDCSAKALRVLVGMQETSNIEHPTSDVKMSEALAEIVAAGDAEWPWGQKGKLTKQFGVFFEEARFLASQFETVGQNDGLGADWANVRSSLRALLLLAREFGARFAEAKRDLAGVDFADLEQFALRLLWDETGHITLLARQWQATLEHVFVDECQDINAAQDAILRAVSRGNCENSQQPRRKGISTPDPSQEGKEALGNRFLVGDVKQSIYQFRLARPALFRGYEGKWQDGSVGQRILLTENFRSAAEILEFVNALFAPLMRNAVGAVKYEPLMAGRMAESLANTLPDERRVEFHLIPKEGVEREGLGESEAGMEIEDLQAIELEARLVAMRLQELHRSGLEIWDKEHERLRRVEWRDMAVLLRSPTPRVEAFAQEFHKCGVPLQAARGGFLQSTEVMDLLSLVRILDNPLQDIPLLAVLRSPLVALTLDELAEIRSFSKEKRFWSAVQEFHRADPARRSDVLQSVWRKVDVFSQRFAIWRELARQASLSRCLERALAETHYEHVIQAGERGAERGANVRKFLVTVRQYDPYQRQGLFRFLKFVDALEAAGQDITPAPAQTQNAVRLMSIHQSKGQEFPVVVVGCLGALFNFTDLSRDVLLDEEFGLCVKAVQPGTGIRHPTWAHWRAVCHQRQQLLGEELRLLYVAMTRARDHLLLTATATRKDSEVWEALPPREFTNREILTVRCPLDWLLLWLPTVTRTEDWQSNAGLSQLLRWRIWSDRRDRELSSVPSQGKEPTAPAPNEDADSVTDPVVRRIHWRYGHEAAAMEAAKTSVTALRRKADELADEEAVLWDRVAPTVFRVRPRKQMDAAGIGTLHHQFLQRMALDGPCDEADLRTQLAVMVEQGRLGAELAASLDLGALAEFWQGDVGCEIRANATNVFRELPFTARFAPGELGRILRAPEVPELEGEFVVVQGVADLVVMGNESLCLLDFKTDEVGGSGELSAKIELYRPQLELYALALSSIYHKPVTQRRLHFINARQTVAV